MTTALLLDWWLKAAALPHLPDYLASHAPSTLPDASLHSSSPPIYLLIVAYLAVLLLIPPHRPRAYVPFSCPFNRLGVAFDLGLKSLHRYFRMPTGPYEALSRLLSGIQALNSNLPGYEHPFTTKRSHCPHWAMRRIQFGRPGECDIS